MLNTNNFCSSDASTPNTYADNYQASSSGGCFTTRNNRYCTGKKTLYGNSSWSPWPGRPYDVWVMCPVCGTTYGATTSQQGNYEDMIALGGTACGKLVGYYYTRSCGKTNGTKVWEA